ncbi:uncharacterized protein LOC131638058 [Vicia villosa]|uniref:uncharacterized protein LOC131638058 n=1 Tax=Vicia villosa TaxID=3911 RepID=UPI00273B93B8|nr:uncharacterized protein LOC131638058 [Vicia villosa]
MVIDTPASDSVTTLSACLNFSVNIFGREFRMDLTVLFPEAINADDLAMTARQVKEAVEDGATMFILFTLMNLKEKAVSSELPVVCDFSEVFLEDVNELPSEREVEFAIDLNSGTSPV